MKYLYALLFPVGLLIATYAPVFAAISQSKLPFAWIPPAVIIGSLALTLLLMIALKAKTGMRWVAFGFCSSARQYSLAAVFLGIVLGAALQYVVSRFPAHDSMDFSRLPWPLLLFYFGIMAPVQEEAIFRGLLQTTSARMLVDAASSVRTWLPVLICAALFGAVHFELNFATAMAAAVLGLIAGDLRRRSGSLLPAFILHALCNGWSIVWPHLFR